MKIDIHVHTKKVKSGDAFTREITPERFGQIIKLTDVRICAITNHNCFDKSQYNEIVRETSNDVLVWPGIEIDVDENGNAGHLLVIVNPLNVDKFDVVITSMLSKKSPDTFKIGISDIGKQFDPLDAIYIPHYYNKLPNISDESIDKLCTAVSNPKRIIKEATNSISAGIFVSHGHKTIFGSDIQNWDEYETVARQLPDLRLPVESFEQFCLLIERDDSTIETVLNKKHHQLISIKPFKEDEPFDIEIWDDINVFFGSKGTGKTEILKALSKYYNNNGHKTTVFESHAINLAKHYDLYGNSYQLNMEDFPIDSCKAEFSKIRTAHEKNITSVRRYFEYYSVDETSKIAKSIKVRDLSPIDNHVSKIKLKGSSDLMKKIIDIQSFVQSKELYKEVIGEDLFDEFMKILDKVEGKVFNGIENEFVAYQTAHLYNNIIEVFAAEISKKTGMPEKPISTGFNEYASNRLELEVALIKIIKNIETVIPPKAEFVWDLEQKGKLFCKTCLLIQEGNVVDGNFRHLNSTTKNPEKLVAKKIREIMDAVYTDELFVKINDLNNIEGGSQVNSIEDLILFRRFFELDHREYGPSNGESAMILLAQELSSEKEIFIIDEPEKSLGNDYISNYIVPLLKEHAYSGKRIIIATHDANIAVRTLPYNSIYREHDVDGYRSYYGNPFSNNLVCKESGKKLNWKEESMRTLEGGKEAFGERGKIYGNA